MKKRSLCVAWLSVILAAAMPRAPHADSYGTELPFVIGVGARASGMGLAYTSLKGDPAVQYFNPALLADIKWKQFQFFRTVLFDSKSLYHTVSYTHPTLNYGTLGISILRLDISGIEERDDNNQLLSSDLKNSQTRILLGYAKNVHSGFSAGFNLKIDNQSFGELSGSGVGIDVGLASSQQIKNTRFIKELREGLAIQNIIEPSVKLDQEKVSDPMRVVFGVSALSEFDKVSFITSIDLVNPRYSPFSFRFGEEITILDRFFLRAGIDDTTPTFGLGAAYRMLTVDYAFRDEDLGSNHRISLSVSFGLSTDETREKARRELEEEINAEINRKMDSIEQEQITSSIEKADRFFVQEDYENAIGSYEIVLYWDPENEHARDRLVKAKYNISLNKGLAFMKEADCLQAIYHFRQALMSIPGDSTAASHIRACEQRLSESRDQALLIDQLLRKGIDLYAYQRFSDALLAFEEILKIQPTNILAQEYRQKAQVNIANVKQRLTLRSRTLASKEEYYEAIKALEQALMYVPNDQMIMSEIEILRQKHKEALAEAQSKEQQKIPRKPDTVEREKPHVDLAAMETRYKRGMDYFEAGDFDRATRSLLELWTIDPDFHDVSNILTKAYLLVGMQFYSQEQYDKAIESWEKALKIEPNNIKAKRFLMKTKGEIEKLGGVSNE